MDMAPQFDMPFGNADNNPAMTKGKIGAMLTEYKKVKWDIQKIFDLDIFNFEDVAVNTIYALSLEHLVYMWELIDKVKTSQVKKHYLCVKASIIEKYWDNNDKIFYGCYHKAGKEYRVKIKRNFGWSTIAIDM